MDTGITLLYCPFPTRAAARAASHALLEKKLAACCNILPAGESHYLWEGAETMAEEHILLAKTLPAMADTAATQLAQHHPYSCPAILRFTATANPAFAAWAATIINEFSSAPIG